MEMNFCYLCGHPTTIITDHGGLAWKCQSCAQSYYPNPKPASEMILVDEHGRVAVAVRARDPYKGKLDLPGGFIDASETLEQGIAREVREELGLSPEYYSAPVYLTSAHADYPWGREITQVVAASFTARIPSSVKFTASDDVASIELTDLSRLTPADFAWPTQYDRIKQAVEYWRNHSS